MGGNYTYILHIVFINQCYELLLMLVTIDVSSFFKLKFTVYKFFKCIKVEKNSIMNSPVIYFQQLAVVAHLIHLYPAHSSNTRLFSKTF